MKRSMWAIPGYALFMVQVMTAGCADGDTARRGPAVAGVDGVFAEYDRAGSPGCALGVMKDDELIYKRGYGMASLEYDLPITPESVFRIGSVSKQFTAASIALLAEEGKISLDDDIRIYLPEIPDYGKTITVRHLVHHTSGLRDYTGLAPMAGFDGGDHYTREESLRLIARQKGTDFDPGEKYSYCNSGYFLLSQIVERASGRTLREYAQERIFAPLGMSHTHFHDNPYEIVSSRAYGYSPEDDGGYRIDMTGWDQVGDGGVFTTIEDLLLWDRNFYDNRLGRGGPKLIETLTTPGVLSDGKAIDYAFALSVGDYRGLRTVSHGGSWVGFRAHRIRFPEQHFSVAVLCNVSTANPGTLARRVADLYLDGEFTEGPIGEEGREDRTAGTEGGGSTEGELERFEGHYWNDESMSAREIRASDGQLLYVRGGGYDSRLIGVGDARFVPEDEPDVTVSFPEPPGGTARAMIVEASDGDRTSYEAFEPATPTASALSRYEGVYECGELDARYVLDVQDGQLVYTVGHFRERPLRPLFPGIFQYQGWITFTFSLESTGRAVRFSMQTGRAHGLECVRKGPQ